MIVDEVCEYPDSNKVGIFVGEIGKRYRKLFVADQDVPYAHGETNEVLWDKK